MVRLFFCLFVFILGTAVVSICGLTGLTNTAVSQALAGWRDQLFSQTTLFCCWQFSQVQLLHGNLADSTAMMLHCKDEACPLLYLAGRQQHTHTRTHTVITGNHKLNWLLYTASSHKDLFIVKHQWKLEIHTCISLFKTTDFFSQMFCVFLEWFFPNTNQANAGPAVNMALSTIYLLWEQHCELRIWRRAVHRLNPRMCTCYQVQLRSLCCHVDEMFNYDFTKNTGDVSLVPYPNLSQPKDLG